MTTTRALRDEVKNALDFLSQAELILYANEVAMSSTRVTWHALSRESEFLVARDHATVDQYLTWASGGAYSAAFLDGSLLQLTYDVAGGKVVGHRLAFVPCPVVVDQALLLEGEPIADLVPMYLESEPVSIALRSPIRFDFDPSAARAGHPAAHLSINTADCRIACVAPMHPYRFIDFVFRHFYPRLRATQMGWFDAASRSHIGDAVLAGDDGSAPHVMWSQHAASASSP